jgi:hypothetical protein
MAAKANSSSNLRVVLFPPRAPSESSTKSSRRTASRCQGEPFRLRYQWRFFEKHPRNRQPRRPLLKLREWKRLARTRKPGDPRNAELESDVAVGIHIARTSADR